MTDMNEYIATHTDELVESLAAFVRIPSISADMAYADDCRSAANWVAELLDVDGCEVTVHDTRGHPIVVGRHHAGDDAPTVMIYGHYDVQPEGDLSEWTTPPFEPTIREGAIFGRGVADDKGQILAHVHALRHVLREQGTCGVNVIMVVEGEEETASDTLADFLREHADTLACDAVVISDTCQLGPGRPAITYGTKGLVYKQIDVRGPATDLHSGSYGGAVVNPANALATILAGLKDVDNRVAVDGFYDAVVAPDQFELQAEQALPFDEQAFRASVGVDETDGEKGYTTRQRQWLRPTLDVNGLLAGYTGEGSKTVLPARAMAKVSMRLVPDQDPQVISEAFDATVRRLTPPGVQVQITTLGTARPYVAPLGWSAIESARQVIGQVWGVEPAMIREGGTLPILPMFREVLGAESLLIGLAMPDCRAHGPDEYFRIDDYLKGMAMSAKLLLNIGQALRDGDAG